MLPLGAIEVILYSGVHYDQFSYFAADVYIQFEDTEISLGMSKSSVLSCGINVQQNHHIIANHQ